MLKNIATRVVKLKYNSRQILSLRTKIEKKILKVKSMNVRCRDNNTNNHNAAAFLNNPLQLSRIAERLVDEL